MVKLYLQQIKIFNIHTGNQRFKNVSWFSKRGFSSYLLAHYHDHCKLALILKALLHSALQNYNRIMYAE